MRFRLATVFSALILSAGALLGPRSTADAAVSQLTISQICSPAMPGTVRVTFSWTGNAPGSQQQWLDLSLANNGWQPGTFLGAGPFSSATTSYTWDGLLPDAVHYVRVNQQLPAGNWDPSQTFTFATASCVAGSLHTGATGGSRTACLNRHLDHDWRRNRDDAVRFDHRGNRDVAVG